MKSKEKRNAFFMVLGSSLLIIAMLLILPFMVTMDNQFPYWLINVIILFFLIVINYNAFRMWQFKEETLAKAEPKTDDVELEIKEPAKD